MRRTQGVVAGVVAATLSVGCASPEMERKAAEGRKAAETATESVAAAGKEIRKSAGEIAGVARETGIEAAKGVTQVGAQAAIVAADATKVAADALASAAVTAAVKTALAATPGLDGSRIDVDTSVDARAVTLTGTVRSAAQKATAEAVARKAAGAVPVKSALTVG